MLNNLKYPILFCDSNKSLVWSCVLVKFFLSGVCFQNWAEACRFTTSWTVRTEIGYSPLQNIPSPFWAISASWTMRACSPKVNSLILVAFLFSQPTDLFQLSQWIHWHKRNILWINWLNIRNNVEAFSRINCSNIFFFNVKII